MRTIFFFGPHQGELVHLVHHVVLKIASRHQCSELSGATMIPQMTVVTDLTRSEDLQSLKPGYAVGDCHTHRLPRPPPPPGWGSESPLPIHLPITPPQQPNGHRGDLGCHSFVLTQGKGASAKKS